MRLRMLGSPSQVGRRHLELRQPIKVAQCLSKYRYITIRKFGRCVGTLPPTRRSGFDPVAILLCACWKMMIGSAEAFREANRSGLGTEQTCSKGNVQRDAMEV